MLIYFPFGTCLDVYLIEFILFIMSIVGAMIAYWDIVQSLDATSI